MVKRVLSVLMAVSLLAALFCVVPALAADAQCTVKLVAIDKDWWPSADNCSNTAGTTAEITGDGTYTLSWNVESWEAVDGVIVLALDFVGAKDQVTSVSNIIILADGVEQAVDGSRIVSGDLENNGNHRVELYNIYGPTAEAAAIDPAMSFGTNLTVTFTVDMAQIPETTEATAVTQPEVTGPEVPVSGEIMFQGEQPIPNAWGVGVSMYTNAFGGVLDPASIALGSYFTVTYTGTAGQLILALQDNAWARWDKVFPSSEETVEGMTTAVFTYEDLTAVYGTDLSGLACVNVCAENANDIVITRVLWTEAPEVPQEPSEPEEPTQPLEPSEPQIPTDPLPPPAEDGRLEYDFVAAMGYVGSNWWPHTGFGPESNSRSWVTGAGTYYVTWEPDSGAGETGQGAVVFVVDIMNAAAELAKDGYAYQLTELHVRADGVSVPVDISKVAVGDLEGNGNFRIELYNEYGSTKDALDVSALQVSEELTVAFTLVIVDAESGEIVDDSNPQTGDLTPIIALSVLVVSAALLGAAIVLRGRYAP